MSSSQSYSYTSSSYSSSTSTNPAGHTQTYTESSKTDPRGTTTHRTEEETGKRPIQETTYIPAEGQIGRSGTGVQGRVEDSSNDQQTQAAKDAEYEEKMEDEYAKREGGA